MQVSMGQVGGMLNEERVLWGFHVCNWGVPDEYRRV